MGNDTRVILPIIIHRLWIRDCGDSILEGSDEIHVFETVARRFRVFVRRNRHPNLRSANRAPVHDLDLAQFASRGGSGIGWAMLRKMRKPVRQISQATAAAMTMLRMPYPNSSTAPA